jgi:NAD(P)-dependent dehydrogenase (short-subunit alcohol dehydrogenase family)
MAQRTVVVTGASTGIGRATVVELVSAGYQVFATVR